MLRKITLTALLGAFLLSMPMAGVSQAYDFHHHRYRRHMAGTESNLLMKRDEAQAKYHQDMAEGRRGAARNQYNSIQNLNHQLYENDRNGTLRHGDYR